MITIYERSPGSVNVTMRTGAVAIPGQAVWVDLLNASTEELKTVEHALGIEIPTSDAMQDLEIGSKLYLGKGALYMIADIVHRQGTAKPETHPTTFILVHNRLVTVRYGETKPLATFAMHAHKDPSLLNSGEEALLGMFEVIIGQTGQLMRELATQIDSVSRIIFWQATGEEDKTIASKLGLRSALYGVGHAGEVAARVQESLMSIDRLLGFYTEFVQPKENSQLANRLVGMQRDVQSLAENGEFLSQKTSFLLDATLGFINAEQNQIIKIFSVAAVILLPPTLVATIYGMNFRFMPELNWPHGYAFALVLMFIAGFLPYLYFKRRGWI